MKGIDIAEAIQNLSALCISFELGPLSTVAQSALQFPITDLPFSDQEVEIILRRTIGSNDLQFFNHFCSPSPPCL
jgi:hypothetical protein